MISSVSIVAYLALFVTAGVAFLLVNLLIGQLLRPNEPSEEKGEIYECGEPTIGSSYVQFDLRFYVVALLFIIFDVEVAFFFPWGTMYGKANNLADPQTAILAPAEPGAAAGAGSGLSDEAVALLREMGFHEPPPPALGASAQFEQNLRAGARDLALISILDILVFFAVLMLGFAYVWKRGDLDWVRALSRQSGAQPREPPSASEVGDTVLTA